MMTRRDGRQGEATMKKRKPKKPRKQSSNRLSAIAARVLGGGKYTVEEVWALAGSVLGQDETRGQR